MTMTTSSVSRRDKEEILLMIEWGWEDDDILDVLPHIERASVTAYRAHVTRGTYEKGVTDGRE